MNDRYFDGLRPTYNRHIRPPVATRIVEFSSMVSGDFETLSWPLQYVCTNIYSYTISFLGLEATNHFPPNTLAMDNPQIKESTRLSSSI